MIDKIINNNGRTCNSCGVFYGWDMFYTDSNSNTGHKASCKICVKAQQRKIRNIANRKVCKNCQAVLTEIPR